MNGINGQAITVCGNVFRYGELAVRGRICAPQVQVANLNGFVILLLFLLLQARGDDRPWVLWNSACDVASTTGRGDGLFPPDAWSVQVHKAINLSSGAAVAVKLIGKEKLRRPHERQSIEKEIETMRVAVEKFENGHPHIVRLLCTKESQHHIFIVQVGSKVAAISECIGLEALTVGDEGILCRRGHC